MVTSIKTGLSIQVCINNMLMRKDISNDLREAIVAAHQSGKGYMVISKQFHYCTERKIFHKWKTFKTVDIPASSSHGQTIQVSVSMFNIKVHDSTTRKRLQVEILFFLKKKEHGSSIGLEKLHLNKPEDF